MIELWGKYTWIMLHTLAEKIKTEYKNDINIVKDFWKQIQILITHLPCPYCSSHAANFLKTVIHNKIKHTDDIKLILFTFHNNVNTRLNKNIFEKNDLQIYSSKNTISSFNDFYYNFNIATNHGMAFHKSLIAKHTLSMFQKWFIENKNVFNM
jgi:hypothetical protein